MGFKIVIKITILKAMIFANFKNNKAIYDEKF